MSHMVMNSGVLDRNYSQRISSDPSRQSARPSQTCSGEMHSWPSSQAWDSSEHGTASTHLLSLAKKYPLGHLQVAPSGFGRHIWLHPPLSLEQLLLPVDPPPINHFDLDGFIRVFCQHSTNTLSDVIGPRCFFQSGQLFSLTLLGQPGAKWSVILHHESHWRILRRFSLQSQDFRSLSLTNISL